MKAVPFRTVSENTWLFPTDTVGTPRQTITLHAARGGNVNAKCRMLNAGCWE